MSQKENKKNVNVINDDEVAKTLDTRCRVIYTIKASDQLMSTHSTIDSLGFAIVDCCRLVVVVVVILLLLFISINYYLITLDNVATRACASRSSVGNPFFCRQLTESRHEDETVGRLTKQHRHVCVC